MREGVIATRFAIPGLNIDSRRVARFHANEPPRLRQVVGQIEPVSGKENEGRNVTRK